ncbi:MAG: ATP-dependent Clp protease ATP-binding subunit, partial [Lachnospiraceae bacterium]|nr:ATP-dependent Clp protease ATP-binding subunit [Lachnospiraceae bacterium]
NTVIIMTSNAGAENIIAPKVIGFASHDDAEKSYQMMKEKVMDEVRRLFRPEFLNRLDEIIVFRQLTKENMGSITDLMMKDFARRLKEERGIELKTSPAARSLLIEKGYDPKFGARPLRRTIQTMVEDPLADELLEGRIKDKDRVLVDTDGKGAIRFIRRK